jgi:hypothetical protein
MIHYFNSPFLYWEKCDDHFAIKDLILPEIENDYLKNKEYYRDNNSWECNCTSSFHSKIGEQFDSVNQSIMNKSLIVNAIFKVYNNMMQRLLDDNSINEKEFNYFTNSYLDDLWYNYYQPGENQEIHEHLPNIFSGVYLLELCGEYNNTVWYNGGSNVFLCDSTMTFGQKRSIDNDIGEGTIIIFPSALPHYVPNTKSKKVTLSFNILPNP